jgi:hypothetical protein
LRLSDLQTNVLGQVIIKCLDCDDLNKALVKYGSSTLIIACNSNDLIGVDRLLIDHPIDTLYVLNLENDKELREWLDGLVWYNIIQVQNKKQLMLRLCTKTMLSYFNQGMEYKTKGNFGLANLCFRDSLNALDYSAKFI